MFLLKLEVPLRFNFIAYETINFVPVVMLLKKKFLFRNHRVDPIGLPFFFFLAGGGGGGGIFSTVILL